MTGQKSKLRNKKDGAGFTLIEMLVVVAIFSILMIAVIGVFVSVMRTQRYYLSSQQLLNQTSYVMEYMSRYIRMAKKDSNGGCITPEYTFISPNNDETKLRFLNYRGECHNFYLGGVGNNQLIQNIGGIVQPLTSSDIEVKSFKFYVIGGGPDDMSQPRVTIFLEAEGVKSSPRPKIKIQTTVSQRNLDI